MQRDVPFYNYIMSSPHSDLVYSVLDLHAFLSIVPENVILHVAWPRMSGEWGYKVQRMLLCSTKWCLPCVFGGQTESLRLRGLFRLTDRFVLLFICIIVLPRGPNPQWTHLKKDQFLLWRAYWPLVGVVDSQHFWKSGHEFKCLTLVTRIFINSPKFAQVPDTQDAPSITPQEKINWLCILLTCDCHGSNILPFQN